MKSLFYYFQDESEWPSISGLQAKVNELSSVTRREISSDSGIHEMTEEKRRSAKRIEYVLLLILHVFCVRYQQFGPVLKVSEKQQILSTQSFLRVS